MTIPIGITAKNEAINLPRLIERIQLSVAFAESELNLQFEIHVVLNDNSDESEKILKRFPSVYVWHTEGGIVEAQRFFKKIKVGAPFLIFSDADILIEKNCIKEICLEMINNKKTQVAYSEKYPLLPKRKTLLAKALYLYNLNNGYQNRRNYFNGQLFAIRHWSIPDRSELSWKSHQNDNFLNLEAGIRCDDIYLSRDILDRYGPEAIVCTSAAIWYRPPETLQGMYRKFQRMVLEIERLNCFFPKSITTHNRFGKRQLQKKLILTRPLSEIAYYGIFLAGLYLCKSWYAIEKFYYRYFSRKFCPTWNPVLETKDLS